MVADLPVSGKIYLHGRRVVAPLALRGRKLLRGGENAFHIPSTRLRVVTLQGSDGIPGTVCRNQKPIANACQLIKKLVHPSSPFGVRYKI